MRSIIFILIFGHFMGMSAMDPQQSDGFRKALYVDQYYRDVETTRRRSGSGPDTEELGITLRRAGNVSPDRGQALVTQLHQRCYGRGIIK